MSNVTITAQTDISTLPAKSRAIIRKAYAALADTEVSDARLARAVHAVGAMRGLGLSVRGIVAVLSVEGKGTLPTGKGSIERYGYVADAVQGEWPADEEGEHTPAIVRALYRIAQTGKASDVARAAEAGRKASTAEDAYTAVDAVRQELNAAEHKSLTTAPERTPAIGSQGADEETPSDDETPGEPTIRETVAAITAASVGSLIAELTRRVTAKAFTPDATLIESFEALASAFEDSIVTDDAPVDVTA